MPSSRPLRSLLGTAFAATVTSIAWFRLHSRWSLGFFAFALFLFALALCVPRAFAPIQAALDRLGRVIASAVTILLLGLLFSLVFVPGRLLLALLRRDPLHRRPDSTRTTYWKPLPPAGANDRFRHQF